jgi:prevent-host-death family protein
MVWVSVEEIQRDLSAYLQRVEAGETLVIVQAGQPVAEVKPMGMPDYRMPCGIAFVIPIMRLTSAWCRCGKPL